VDVVVEHWSASWPVLIGYVALAAWHLAGLRRTLALVTAGSRHEMVREAALFQLGLAVIALALISPIGYLSDVYIWVRALQELLVAVIGPGLIVLGAPWAALRIPPGRLASLTSRPVLAVIAANVVWLGWQLPVLFDAAHGSAGDSGAGIALAEHVSYVAAGLLFWLQLVSSRPLSQRTSPMRRAALLVGTVLASTVLGMMLVFGNGVVYPVYANSAHHLMTVLDDQQLSGAVLWMGMLGPMIVAGVALVLEWFGDEESAELSAGLDRLLTPRGHGWPSRPVIR
jgi:cytochrome c oxidase assembly factor CtaG